METMKLKDIVALVEKTLNEHQAELANRTRIEWSNIMNNREAMKWLIFRDGFDLSEIEHLNETFWTSGINPNLIGEIARGVALCIDSECLTDSDRRQKLEWLQNFHDNVCLPIVKRINRRPYNKNKKSMDWRHGVFTKFDFIARYGYLYDSEEEANDDANAKDATCPLLMGILNSGWENIKAKEDVSTGKITVSEKDMNVSFGPSMFLPMIIHNMETIIKQHEYEAEHNSWLFKKLKWRTFNPSRKPSHGDAFTLAEMPDMVNAMISVMLDEEKYPQSAYDFRTCNREFLKFVKHVQGVIEHLDETQVELVKQTVSEIIEKMTEYSQIEVTIVNEQQMRDETGRFLKPKFDLDYLVYTYALATMLCVFDSQYRIVNRIDYQKIYKRYHNHDYLSYVVAKYHNTLDSLIKEWQRNDDFIKTYHPICEEEKLKQIPKYEQWYLEESVSPFFFIDKQYEPLLQTQYLDE